MGKDKRRSQKDKSLSEIILSGGDPLSLNNKALEKIIKTLNTFSHIERIRIHTRFPIADPNRLDNPLLKILKNSNKKVFFILHVNHPHELGDDLFAKLENLQKIKIPILTQSVLLKNINDNVSTLSSLFTLLVNNGIIPYYLHQLDQVEGTHHFKVPIKKGIRLMQEIQKILPGYAIPKYVQEVPFKKNKTLINMSNLDFRP